MKPKPRLALPQGSPSNNSKSVSVADYLPGPKFRCRARGPRLMHINKYINSMRDWIRVVSRDRGLNAGRD